jgi:hypothetical protein
MVMLGDNADASRSHARNKELIRLESSKSKGLPERSI